MPARTDRPRLMSIDDVAHTLGISPRTVKRRIADGDLAAHKVGRQWRIAMRDVESYLRKHRFGGDRGVL